jgi:hypothetical protein
LRLANLDLSDSNNRSTASRSAARNRQVRQPSASSRTSLGRGAGQKRKVNLAEIFDLGSLDYGDGKGVFGSWGNNKRTRLSWSSGFFGSLENERDQGARWLLRSLASLPAFTFPDAHVFTSPTTATTYRHQHRNRRHFTALTHNASSKIPWDAWAWLGVEGIHGASFHHLVNIITTAMTTTLHLCRGSFRNEWTDG